MIDLHYSKHLLQVRECWFWNAARPPAFADGVDLVLLRQAVHPHGKYAQEFGTLVTNLSPDSHTIFADFCSDCRWKIRRAIRDGIMVGPVELTDNALREFTAFHDTFAHSRGLPTVHYEKLVLLRSARSLAITQACYQGEVLVYHAYIYDQKRARVLYSSSHFRSGDSSRKTIIGHANRYLHWHDMLAFKSLGLVEYDWGGIADDSDASLAGINRFKKEFHGTPERSYHCLVPSSLLGRIGVEVVRLSGSWQRTDHGSLELIRDGDNKATVMYHHH